MGRKCGGNGGKGDRLHHPSFLIFPHFPPFPPISPHFPPFSPIFPYFSLPWVHCGYVCGYSTRHRSRVLLSPATKTCSDTQRVRMSSGERPIGAAKGKQPNTEALCQRSPPLPPLTPLMGPIWGLGCGKWAGMPPATPAHVLFALCHLELPDLCYNLSCTLCCVVSCCVVLCRVVLCCVVLCCVVLCCAVLCCAVLCGVVLCCVVLCCVVLCCVVLCCAVLCCAVLCDVVLCCVVLCCVVLCCVVLCCVVLCCVVWCGVVWCGVVWCGVVWCGVVWCCDVL